MLAATAALHVAAAAAPHGGRRRRRGCCSRRSHAVGLEEEEEQAGLRPSTSSSSPNSSWDLVLAVAVPHPLVLLVLPGVRLALPVVPGTVVVLLLLAMLPQQALL